MSTQSIIHKDLQTLSDNADQTIMCMAENYLLKVKYGVGNGYDSKDFKKILWLDRILCEDYCRLYGIMEKVKEKLNLITLKYI
ncbi:MAG: hypothetical protein KC414_09255 [Romboutsia sp.]|nr:hypothetical protein [Romboutsia sp.]